MKEDPNVAKGANTVSMQVRGDGNHSDGARGVFKLISRAELPFFTQVSQALFSRIKTWIQLY